MPTMSESCISHSIPEDAPVIKGVVYGSRDEAEKLKKRINCASGRLGVRWQLQIEPDLFKATDVGVTRLPSLMINGQLVIEGLLQTEEIEALLEGLKVQGNNTI